MAWSLYNQLGTKKKLKGSSKVMKKIAPLSSNAACRNINSPFFGEFASTYSIRIKNGTTSNALIIKMRLSKTESFFFSGIALFFFNWIK